MPKGNIRSSFLESLYLALGICFIWFWVGNPVLVNYNLQLTAILVLIYFITRFFIGKRQDYLGSGLILDTVIFTLILLLVISSTGGLGSSLFFLIYLLLFAVALIFDPPVTLTLTLALVLFFANTLTTLHAALQLLSLLFITPLALFFGRQYLRLLEAKEKIKILKKRGEILAKEGKELKEAVSEEETSSLLWLSLDFKNSLLQIVHQTGELMSDIGHLTYSQKEKLESVHQTAKEVLKSGEKLKEKIDRETD